MYKLIIDKILLEDFNKIAETCEIKVEELDKITYLFLRQNSRPIIDSIFGGDLCPVRTLVTIRTDLTNEVIVPNKGKFYTDCTASYPNEHPLDDMIMLAGKKLVDALFDCGNHIQEIILATTVYPLGACVHNGTAYVYINVVIDHNLKNNPHFKLRDCHLEKIESLSPTSPLEKELVKNLILVKGDNNNV